MYPKNRNDRRKGIMSYLLSIVVPIKNNYSCLKSIIDKVINMNRDETELVIQDNTKNNSEIKEYLAHVKASFIKYYHYPKDITMSENFNLGILNSTGRYLCILGADDNVSSKLLNVAKYLDRNNYESAVFHKAIYYWPGMKFRAHKKRPNLVIPKCTGEIFKLNAEEELKRLLKQGMTSLGKLPEPYQGIVKRDTLQKVYELTGNFVPGACPDMAMAVALSQVIKSYIFIDVPIILSGLSYNSAGGKGARGEHKGQLKDMKFLTSSIEEAWPIKIPKIWTGATIYADSTHSALIAVGEFDQFEKFNYAANYANLISFFPEYWNLVKPFIRKNVKLQIKVALHSGKIFTKRSYVYIKNWITANFGISRNKIFYDVKTSFDASELVDKYIETNINHKEYLNS